MRKVTAAIFFLCALASIPAYTVFCEEYTPYLSVGQTETFLVNADGELFTWDNKGEIVIGTNDYVYSPKKIRDNVRYASNNDNHTVIITRDNELWAYGSNRHGQLGDGTNMDRPTPVKVMEDVAYAETGRNFTVILKTNGEIWVCGSSHAYTPQSADAEHAPESEDAEDADILTPVKVMDDVKTVSCGGAHVVALKNNGELWGWGDNQAGALGNGTTADVLQPELIMADVKTVSTSLSKTVAVDTNGRTWEWGMIGKDSNDVTRESIFTSPREVKARYESVYAGRGYSLGLESDGALYIWGRADFTSSNDYFYTAEKLAERIVYATAGQQYAAAIDQDGALKFWSRNAHGITDSWLGNYIPKPVTIMTGLALSAEEDRETVAGSALSAISTPVYAVPSAAKTYVKDKRVLFDSYNIDGSNYYKLRDIALALTDTACRFSVAWQEESGSIIIGLGAAYQPIGGELEKGDGTAKAAVVSNAKLIAAPQDIVSSSSVIYLNHHYRVSASAYVINGNTYFKLRDLGDIIAFKVVWDPTVGAVIILTD
ncbi:MAG: hypothetical protein LBB94_02840 [Clostridiales bacterium]|jgi:alpha-tubulin suppressor-like RCC1 family protein|nr:hypothetical protein [Clostridiales bacterium]